MLLQTPGVQLFEFAQAEAYARRYRLPEPGDAAARRGGPGAQRAAARRALVAPTCSLVAREDTASGAGAAVRAGGAQDPRRRRLDSRAPGSSPSPQNTEFPLARDAERYYRNGPPLLQRYLPFWLANLVDRMWVALFSIIAILIPLARVVPPLYQFRIRSRVFRWYRDLRQIEDDLARKDADRAEAAARSSTSSTPRPSASRCRSPTPTSSTRCAATSRWCASGCGSARLSPQDDLAQVRVGFHVAPWPAAVRRTETPCRSPAAGGRSRSPAARRARSRARPRRPRRRCASCSTRRRACRRLECSARMSSSAFTTPST